MNWIFSLVLFLFHLSSFSQTLDPSRATDWTLTGLQDTTTIGFIEIDMLEQGVLGDGVTPNDPILTEVLSTTFQSGAILNFPTGNFLFNERIDIPSHVIIRGQGADKTTFTFDLGGTGHSISINGDAVSSDTTHLLGPAIKDSHSITVSDISKFTSGDWIQIIQDDSDLVTSSWAQNTVGQIAKIQNISADKIFLGSPLRMDYNSSRSPYIMKLAPRENVGIECLKILRVDDTAPQQSSNINFSYAVNCWIKGIESENCTFSHIAASQSSNLSISASYFHHAFNYDGGGRAYGVMLQATSNECLVENNIFEYLRHSMILQSGANGNVFSYNYSLDPFWESIPSNAAGDMVLHGNYPYLNLFEQNICQNIVIDNSHGPNGPYNTIFRNRAESYGIFFSADNSPDQNLIGNEITNTSFPFNIVNYTIQGNGHFIHGNNNKGTIHPAGTNTLTESSYAYTERPEIIPINQWAGIGTPNTIGENDTPSYDRYQSENIFDQVCGKITSSALEIVEDEVLIYPNPVASQLTLESSQKIQNLTIVNSLGQVMINENNIDSGKHIDTSDWNKGVYFVLIQFSRNRTVSQLVLKTNSH